MTRNRSLLTSRPLIRIRKSQFGNFLPLPFFCLIALALTGLAAAAEQVQPTSPMTVARRGHTATVLADGRVLLVGGLDDSGPVAAAEVFDPTTKAFQAVGNLAVARYGHTATLLPSGLVL